MVDRLPLFVLLSAGCALLLACVMYGCQDNVPPPPETAEASPQETKDSLSLTNQSSPKESSGSVPAESAATAKSQSQPAPSAQAAPAESKPSQGTSLGGETESLTGSFAPKGKTPKFATPEEASSFAQQQLARAEKAAKAGKVAEGYEATVAGWEALQPHCDNDSCKALSDQLLTRMEQYGEQIPSLNSESLLGKPLMIR